MNKTIFKLFLFLSFFVAKVSYAHSMEYFQEKMRLQRIEFEALTVRVQNIVNEGKKGYPIANRSAALIKEVNKKKAQIEATLEDYYAYIASIEKRHNQCMDIMDFMENNGINSEMLGEILAMRDRDMAGSPPDRDEVIELINKFNINGRMINEFKNLGLDNGDF